MRDIKEIRNNIDDIDKKMAILFEQRMELVKDVALYKKDKGLPIGDAKREKSIILKTKNSISDENIKEYYISFIKNNMDISKKYQIRLLKGLKVAYSGTVGAFSYICACELFPSAKKVAYGGFKACYEAVENLECDIAILPIENSFQGDVGQVNDIMFKGDLYIKGMYDLPVVHDILGVKGAKISDIKTLVSHPQALAQCQNFIKKNKIKTIDYSNTALAASYVKEKNDKSIAAIASSKCAKYFDLECLYHSVNDDRNNTTRFAIFSKSSKAFITDKEDTYFSLVFTSANEAGSLAKALDIIGKYGFNMRTLRSRPMKNLMWQYYFYIEAKGDITSKNGKECLKELEKYCDKIKVIGSYNNISYKEN